MRNLFFFISIFASLTMSAAAQSAKPTATPVEDDVVKISTNLIQLDVSVTDLKGKVITDLKPEEIEIYENGKKQKITNFSFVSSVRESTEQAKKKDKAAIDIPVPGVEIRPEKVRRTIALVADDLTLSFESVYHTRLAMKKFVDESMQDGDLVAIIRTGAGMGSLQQFTSDKRLLYAAIEKIHWNSLGTGGIGAFAPIEPTPLQQAAAAGDSSVSEEDLADERNRNNAQDDFRNSIFASGTLGALRFLITGMDELPGRKSVILFSDGFRMMERDESGYQTGTTILDLLRKLIDFANRASVVINTIDPRGLQYTGYTAADNVTDTSPQAMTQAMSDRSDQLFETQQSLSLLARETGGVAIYNNNDVSGSVRKIIDDQSYYLIAYEPDDSTFDTAKVRFNKLVVRVTRKDTRVRHRSGFYSIAEKKDPKQSPEDTPSRQLLRALSSPFAQNGISLRLNPLFGHDVKTGTSFVRSYLHIDGEDLKFTDLPEKKKKAVVTILAASFGENGLPVGQVAKTFTITADEQNLAEMRKEGFIYQFTFPVKKPGGFQYRVALRDDQAATVGSANQFVQVPKIKKGVPIISGIVLQNYTREQWSKQTTTGERVDLDAGNDNSLRRFQRGTVLQFAFEVYGLDAAAIRSGDFTRKIRIFRDGKLVLDGNEGPIDLVTVETARQLGSGAIALGSEMTPGDYVLQIVIVDNSKKKKRYSTQAVQFEIAGS